MTCQLCEKKLPKGAHIETRYHKECKVYVNRARVKVWRQKMRKLRRADWNPMCERCKVKKKFSRNLTVKYCVDCRYDVWSENTRRYRLKAACPEVLPQTIQ